MAIVISENLCANIMGVFGARGSAWLDGLPFHLEKLEQLWRIEIGPPFPMLSFNYVAPATTASGRRAVLKTGVPCPELHREMAALRAYDGHGSVRLLRGNARLGAMLIERIEPGDMLADLEDDEAATRIAAQCMRALWVKLPGGHHFPHVSEWAQGLARLRDRFGGGTGPLPAAMVERAEGLFDELFASEAETVLLHADLHHYNILRDGNGWRVIDPKGMAGDLSYECGAWLRNPSDLLTRPNVADILSRRIAVFSEMLDFERERIRSWAFAQAVLSAWWCLEDNGDYRESGIALARYIDQST